MYISQIIILYILNKQCCMSIMSQLNWKKKYNCNFLNCSILKGNLCNSSILSLFFYGSDENQTLDSSKLDRLKKRNYKNCWKKSWGCDLKVVNRLDPDDWKLLPLPLQSSECVNLYPQYHSQSCFQGLSLERAMCYWDHLDWMCFWSQLRGLYIIWRLWPASARFYFSCGRSRHTWYVIPLVLLNLPSINLEWFGSFLWFLLAFVYGCQFHISARNSWGFEPTTVRILSIYCIPMHSDGEEPMRK